MEIKLANNSSLDIKDNNGNSLASINNNGTISGLQEKLVSGTNIKTINNQSLLGSGNISIQSGGGKTIYVFNHHQASVTISYQEDNRNTTLRTVTCNSDDDIMIEGVGLILSVTSQDTSFMVSFSGVALNFVSGNVTYINDAFYDSSTPLIPLTAGELNVYFD